MEFKEDPFVTIYNDFKKQFEKKINPNLSKIINKVNQYKIQNPATLWEDNCINIKCPFEILGYKEVHIWYYYDDDTTKTCYTIIKSDSI